jgi:hypothetical protein
MLLFSGFLCFIFFTFNSGRGTAGYPETILDISMRMRNLLSFSFNMHTIDLVLGFIAWLGRENWDIWKE